MKKGLLEVLTKYDHMIEWHSDESHDGGNYWFYLKEGYYNPELETDCVAEPTLALVKRSFTKVVRQQG